MWELYKSDNSFMINGLYTAFIKNIKSGFLFPGETHDFWEMMYCIKGNAIISAGERVFTLKENQVVFFHPMEFHSFRVEKETKSKFFIASYEMQGELTDKLKNRVFDLNQEHMRIINEIINTLRLNNSDIDEEEETGFLSAISQIPYRLNIISNMFENFIILISKENAISSHLVKNHETLIYANALRIIDESLGDKITVDMLSKECNVSSTYLKGLFKKYNGLGIHEYILKNKMALSKQMLSEGITVTEIAEKLGFSSQTYFSTVFKRETGLSPSEYKYR